MQVNKQLSRRKTIQRKASPLEGHTATDQVLARLESHPVEKRASSSSGKVQGSTRAASRSRWTDLRVTDDDNPLL
jgi:hypothetical protein